MYTIASLSRPAAKSMLSLQTKGSNHSRAFLIALGFTIGSSLSLSGETEQDVNGYYRLVHSTTVHGVLSKINEFLPFNVREAEDLVKSFYSFRHKSMHPPEIPLAFNADTALVDFFGLSSVFSKCTIDEISSNGAKVSELIVLLRPVCDDLLKSDVLDSALTSDSGLAEKLPS